MKQYHGTYACFFLFHVSDDRALCKPGCASLVVIHWYSWRFWWWLVMFVFIDLKWPRVFRCSTPSCSLSYCMTTESPCTNAVVDIFAIHLNILRQNTYYGYAYFGEICGISHREIDYKLCIWISLKEGPRMELDVINYLLQELNSFPNYFLPWIYFTYSWVPGGKVWLLNSTQLKNGLFDIIVQDNYHVMTTINARS